MAITNFNTLWVPRPPMTQATFARNSFTMNSALNNYGVVFQVPKTGNLWKVGFETGTVVQNYNVRVGFQDVSATGFPDGTDDQFRDVAIADGDDNTWKLSGIISSDGTDGGSLRAVTKGDWVGVLFTFPSFTAGDVFNISSMSGVSYYGNGLHYSTSSGTKIFTTNLHPNILVMYDDGSCAPIQNVTPYIDYSSESYNSGSTPDERGLKFQFPFPVRVWGAWMLFAVGGSSSTFDVVLYDSDGSTPLVTKSFDPDFASSPGNFMNGVVTFASTYDLSASTDYYLTLKPTTANNVSLVYGEVDQASYLDQLDGGSEFHYVAKTDSGSFSATTTKKPEMGLLISGVDSGGSIVNNYNVSPSNITIFKPRGVVGY